MTRIVLRYLALASVRWIGVAIAMVLLVELSFCVVGGSGLHVWESSVYESIPLKLSVQPVGWWDLIAERSIATLLALALAYGGALLFGYAWGIFASRYRRFRVVSLLSLPFSLFSCVPGFWFVILVAIYSYVVWKRPGFANELTVETGPNVLAWWNAAVVALPAMAVATSWQIRSVAEAISREASRPYVRGLYLTGYGEDDIFYRNIMRGALPRIFSLLDRTLPVVLGSLVVLEWAFRYEGVGALLVDSVRLGFYPGIFVSGMWMVTLAGVTTAVRQVTERLLRIE